MKPAHHLRSLRIWLSFFIVGLVLSGVTAFPLVSETRLLVRLLHARPFLPQSIILWVERVNQALYDDSIRAPFLAYGTDWLAFAHIVLAIAFLGPLVDPIRNKWVLQFGVIACASVLALAFIAGSLRGIPLLWRFIDSSFGIFGAIPLLISLSHVRALEEPDSTA